MTLFTHHHYGWRRHELPDAERANIMAALLATHDFLEKYEGKYRVEVEYTPERSYDGFVGVYWDSDEPHPNIASLHRSDHWFRGFEFNVAPSDACRYCGGTGLDHCSGPFFHCWACDGTATQIRESTPRGFMKKPAKGCAAETHRKYADYLAASSGATATSAAAEDAQS